EEAGEFYKAQGVFLWGDPTGPYGYGGFVPLPPIPPYWTEQNRYEWTYGLQMHGWKGHVPLTQLLQGMWAARGDSPAAPNANVAALRSFLSANFDVDEVLTYIALRTWDGVWDDFNHNWFLWRRANGKWGTLPWDFDSEAGGLINSGINTQPTSSIYLGEFGVPTPYWSAFSIVKTCPTCPCSGDVNGCWTDANWMKDSFYKAFRLEYRQKLFILNNTLLNPTNITAIGYSNFRSYADTRFASINSQLGFGVFQRPGRPLNVSPASAQAALPPAVLQASAYTHGSSPAPAHSSTTWFIRNLGGDYSAPVFKTTSTSNLTSIPIPFPDLTFGQTYYWKCIFTDTNGHPSLESAETSFIYGTDTPLNPGAIVLNEIMADNASAVLHGGTHPDYIELFNNSAQSQNLNGFSLSDNTARPGKYIFPPNTIMAAADHLVVWCDSDTNAPGLHTGFALDHEGQTVALFTITTNGFTLSDALTFGLQATDYSIGRQPEGTGSWALNVPTPGGQNTIVSTAPADALKINEWMATDANGPDWFEIYNPQNAPVALGGFYLTDTYSNPTNSRIWDLSFIGPNAFRQFIADQNPYTSARHVNFKLSGSGEAIGLYDTNRVRIDGITFGPQLSGVSQGRLPDGATTIVSFPNSASPEDPNYVPLQSVLINEVLSHSDLPLEDAVEVYNPTGAPVDLSGWWLSDDKNALRKYQIPNGKVVPAGGYLVLYEYEFNATPGLPSSFAFSSARGDAVYLAAADGAANLTGYRSGAQFDAAETGVSFGRFQTSQGSVFVALARRTFGADSPLTVEAFRNGTGGANAEAKVGPVVISEVQYHPPNFPDGSDNGIEEFIELRNISGVLTPLFDPSAPTNTWRLRDAVDYVFPTNTSLAPGEAVLVVSFDPNRDTNALGAFLDAYGPATTRLFGPYSTKLDNSGGSLELVKPGPPINELGPDFGYVPSILVDKVKYEDHFPWPQFADGNGASLMRLTLSAYGNDPTNWFAWYSTPGRSNTTNSPPSVTMTQPSSGTVVSSPTNILLVAQASDTDGTIANVDFFDGANKVGRGSGTGPYQFIWTNASFGPHQITARARDNGSATSVSAPISIRVLSAPPVVTITAPAKNAIFQVGNTVSIAATASDIDTPVTTMEFFVDDTKIGEDALSPYNASWLAVPGPHTISALATDTSGSVSTSAVVSIFVQNVVSSEDLVVAPNSTWRYLDTGANLGTSWTNLNFNDSA
ncbi:MAG TPA: lamin tail domain-containing protein, partial [Candidatus Saccharimonadales bacterium]|nr:lamin tail domain-containing protein [Candidatus Saccharimonadales bacterium]